MYTLKEVGLFYSRPMRNRILCYTEASYDTCKVKQVNNQCKNNEKVKVLDQNSKWWDIWLRLTTGLLHLKLGYVFTDQEHSKLLQLRNYNQTDVKFPIICFDCNNLLPRKQALYYKDYPFP